MFQVLEPQFHKYLSKLWTSDVRKTRHVASDWNTTPCHTDPNHGTEASRSKWRGCSRTRKIDGMHADEEICGCFNNNPFFLLNVYES